MGDNIPDDMWTRYWKEQKRMETKKRVSEYFWGIVIMGGLFSCLIILAQLGE